MMNKTFNSGEFTTNFIPEVKKYTASKCVPELRTVVQEYPEGFKGHVLSEDEKFELGALAATLHFEREVCSSFLHLFPSPPRHVWIASRSVLVGLILIALTRSETEPSLASCRHVRQILMTSYKIWWITRKYLHQKHQSGTHLSLQQGSRGHGW